MVMSFAKYLIPVLVFSASIRAEKEAVDGNTQDAVNKIMTNKLWQEIRKRVLDPPSDEDLFDGLGSQSDDDNVNGNCEFSVEEGIIIKTHDSINLGATFLISPHVNTRQACTKECCSNADCNVAVFKDKGPEYACYLFDCGTDNVCKYTSHPGFSSVHLPQRKTSNKQQEKHANDLEDLIDTSTTTTTAPTTRTTTTSTTASTTPFVPAPLFQPCQRRQDCVDSFAQCLENFCMCQDGYHAQEGVCRKDCNRFEFECANEGHPDTYYPQCIAIYDRCDSNGIKHCKDGSDEINCSIAPKKDLIGSGHGMLLAGGPMGQASSPQLPDLQRPMSLQQQAYAEMLKRQQQQQAYAEMLKRQQQQQMLDQQQQQQMLAQQQLLAQQRQQLLLQQQQMAAAVAPAASSSASRPGVPQQAVLQQQFVPQQQQQQQQQQQPQQAMLPHVAYSQQLQSYGAQQVPQGQVLSPQQGLQQQQQLQGVQPPIQQSQLPIQQQLQQQQPIQPAPSMGLSSQQMRPNSAGDDRPYGTGNVQAQGRPGMVASRGPGNQPQPQLAALPQNQQRQNSEQQRLQIPPQQQQQQQQQQQPPALSANQAPTAQQNRNRQQPMASGRPGSEEKNPNPGSLVSQNQAAQQSQHLEADMGSGKGSETAYRQYFAGEGGRVKHVQRKPGTGFSKAYEARPQGRKNKPSSPTGGAAEPVASGPAQQPQRNPDGGGGGQNAQSGSFPQSDNTGRDGGLGLSQYDAQTTGKLHAHLGQSVGAQGNGDHTGIEPTSINSKPSAGQAANEPMPGGESHPQKPKNSDAGSTYYDNNNNNNYNRGYNPNNPYDGYYGSRNDDGGNNNQNGLGRFANYGGNNNNGYYGNRYDTGTGQTGGTSSQSPDYEQYFDHNPFGYEPNVDYDYFDAGNPQTKVNKDGEVDEKSSSGDKGHEVSSSSSSSSSKSSSKDSDKSQQQPPQESEIATDSEKQSPSEQGNSVPDTPEQGGSNVGPPDRTLQKGDDLVSSDRAAQGVDLVSPDRTSGGREGESVSGSKVMDDSPKGNADVDTAAKVTDQQDKHTLGSKNTSSDVSIEPAAHVQEVDEAAVDDASLSTGHVGFIHQSSKGAVIALALGLAITAMLLIFVGCRLRHVKKRLRRGRPMSSNEADYLINGMYL